jgi:hypothetical protein
MRRRRSRGASTVEWLIIITLAVAVGLVGARLLFSHLASASARAGECIESAGAGSCGQGSSAVTGGDTSGTTTSGLTANELVANVEHAPGGANEKQGEHESKVGETLVSVTTPEVAKLAGEEVAKHLGHEQASAANLIRQTKGTPLEGYARGVEAEARANARLASRIGAHAGEAIDGAQLAVDGIRVTNAAMHGPPDDPAFNDAAGHGGGVLGGAAAGALMSWWCGPWCAVGGAIVGGFIGETGMRALQRKLTAPRVTLRRSDAEAEQFAAAARRWRAQAPRP